MVKTGKQLILWMVCILIQTKILMFINTWISKIKKLEINITLTCHLYCQHIGRYQLSVRPQKKGILLLNWI